MARGRSRAEESDQLLSGKADLLMAEAVRRVLREQYEAMLANEAGSRSPDDMEAIHDMRVAVRRMRVAFRLFGDYFQGKATKQHRQDLRATGRALGQVRDLDVFNREAKRYLRRQPKPRRHELDPLLSRWQEQREQARLQLVAYLDGPQYQRLVQDFGEFVRTPGAGVAPTPEDQPRRFRVRDVLSSTVWRLYETVRAYDRVLSSAPPPTLHALRIDCKHLRYTLEFFADSLGADTPWLITEIVALQDHLGDIQDAEVAQKILGDILQEGATEQSGLTETDLAHIAAYAAYRQEQQKALIAALPAVWPHVDSLRFRRRLAQALLTL